MDKQAAALIAKLWKLNEQFSAESKTVLTELTELLSAPSTSSSTSTTPTTSSSPTTSTPESSDLKFVWPGSNMSLKPFGFNRTQIKHLPYEDGWVVKSSEIALVNAPGFPRETPEMLTRSGHNQHDALWYYGEVHGDDPTRPVGKPKKSDQLFFEVTGDRFNPYRTCYDVLLTDITTIGNSLVKTLPQWNTSEANGIVYGVPTVKECHFNLEYAWFTEDGNTDPKNHWRKWTPEMRMQTYLNYAAGRVETFQETYNRGGVKAIDKALHQKWRNIIGLAIMIINRTSPGIKAYYGDHKGIAEQHHIIYFDQPYNLSDLFSTNVGDASRFGEANEYMNAGEVTVGEVTYNLTGNLRQLAGCSHNYDYESEVFMSAADYDQYSRLTGENNINIWHDKMVPDLYRPYNMALHAQLTDYVKAQKGWGGYRVYWQSEPIYESKIVIKENHEQTFGAWVPWTMDAKAPFRPCKIPLHPEVCGNIVYNARMNLQGLFLWGAYRRQDVPAGRSENTHPLLHQTGREGFQVALDTINSQTVFSPGSQTLLGNIRLWNQDAKNWVDGDASRMVLHNGRNSNGQPAAPLPLVTGKYSPQTGQELYQVYYPNKSRYGLTSVKFKSPIDGAELTATAKGWGATLYIRQGKPAKN